MSPAKKTSDVRRIDVTTRAARLSTKRQKAAFDASVSALCRRLGISDDVPFLVKWASIGMKLAFEQPEFRSQARRGRPRSKNGGVDYQRALVIRSLRREAVAAGLNEPTDASLIEKASDQRHPLFPPEMGADVFASSVSRGNKVFAEAEATAKRQKQRDAARERAHRKREARRKEVEKKRREEWEATLAGGIFGPLNP